MTFVWRAASIITMLFVQLMLYISPVQFYKTILLNTNPNPNHLICGLEPVIFIVHFQYIPYCAAVALDGNQ